MAQSWSQFIVQIRAGECHVSLQYIQTANKAWEIGRTWKPVARCSAKSAAAGKSAAAVQSLLPARSRLAGGAGVGSLRTDRGANKQKQKLLRGKVSHGRLQGSHPDGVAGCGGGGQLSGESSTSPLVVQQMSCRSTATSRFTWLLRETSLTLTTLSSTSAEATGPTLLSLSFLTRFFFVSQNQLQHDQLNCVGWAFEDVLVRELPRSSMGRSFYNSCLSLGLHHQDQGDDKEEHSSLVLHQESTLLLF